MDGQLSTVGEFIPLKVIHLGDLILLCPACQMPSESVAVGMGTQPVDGAETMELLPFGVVGYQCGHLMIAQSLADRAALILNGCEDGYLDLDLLSHMHCGMGAQEEDNEDSCNEEEG